MAYRELVESLAARLEALEAQVGERARERDEVAKLLAEAREHVRREEFAAARPHRRKRLRRWIFAIAGAVAVVIGVLAIRHATRKPDRMTEAVHRLEAFTFEMCSCSDTKCTQGVTDELMKWAQAEAKKDDADPPKPDDQTSKYLQGVVKTMADCLQRAMSH